MNPLPRHTEDLIASLEGRIAIVGNATPRWELGALIDRYETVVRMNNFRVDGYTQLVGSRTTHRCTTGWKDVEHRREHPEFSPFTAQATESGNLAEYNPANHHPVLTARTDVHQFIPELKRPSTGLALVQHFVQLGRPVDLFAFDGFKTPHYWEPERGIYTSHSLSEMDVLLSRPGVILYNETQPVETIPVFRRADDSELYDETIRRLMGWLPQRPGSMRVLAYGVGDSLLADRLEKLGHQVTAVTTHQAAYDQLTCTRKVLGSPLALALMEESFDLFIGQHCLEHLNSNDQRLLLREAGRLCQSLFIATKTPATRAPQNWLRLLQSSGFDATTVPTHLTGHEVHVATGRLTTPPVAACANTASGRTAEVPGAERKTEVLLKEIAQLKEENHGLREQIADLNEEWQTLLDEVQRARRESRPARPAPTQASSAKQPDLAAIETQVREALTIKPDGVEALRLLAGICLQSERWVEAAHAARRVVELKPDDLDALSILAKCFFKTGDLESTRTVLERVLAINPGNEMARENLAALESETLSEPDRVAKLEQLLLAGREAVAAGNVTEAIKLLEAAAQLDPQDADLCVAIASLQAAQGEVEAARRRLSQALAIDAKHTDAGRMLVELALGAPEAAEEEPSTAQAVETQTRPTFDSTDCKGDPSPIGKNNTTAFVQLQRGFDLLKERRFAEAQAESRRYRERVNYDALDRTDNRAGASPKVSVVIVAYKINAGLIQCLDSIAASQNPPHEIIVVDNGGNEAIHAELARRQILHVRVGFNVILAEGRNIGVHFARSNYAVFIDDDAIAAPGYLTAAVEGFESFDVHAFRGKVLPKSDHPHNGRARHYNLGDLPFPADIDTEGNSAFRIDTWRQLGGQDPLLFGGEGVELSRRIGQLHGDFALMYWPFMVIQHDYAVTDNKLETKSSRHALMREYSVFKYPDLYTFHNRLVAFARNSETKAEGHRLLPRHSSREPAATATAVTTQTGEPFISICVPTYNRAEFIEQTLASAFKQTHQNFEIVVVDDGSTDGTAGVMKRITDPRVRFIIKEHSGGPETRNRCIAEARGEFLVWLDSDDLLLPDTLARYAAALREHPQVDVLYGNLQVADDQLNVIERWVYGDYHGWGATLLGDTVIENRIPNVCTLVRKSCYARVGGYNPAFPRAHDYEFWTRLTPVASFKSVNADVGIYRRHEQSLSKVRQQVNTAYEAKAVKAMLEKHSRRALFPSCYSIGTPTAHGEARAWLIAALVMMKYGELASAVEFAGRSAGCAELGLNTRISGLLQVVSGRTKSLPGAKTADEYGRLVEQAARLFASGQVQPCAQACAKLTELRPDAAETLLLVGLSLRRWANPHDAKTAFRCLVQRQCERTHLETITEAEEARRTSAVNGHPLSKFLAPVFRETSIPDEAIAAALGFIARAASAVAPREFLSGHPANQTPLLFAILSLTPDELEQLVDGEVAGQIARLRTALQPATTASPRKPGYSFCIITGGQRREKLARQIASIQALNLPAYEILVGGEVSHVPPGVRKVALTDAARAGRLGKMRNELGRHAEYDHVVVADDDLVFDPGFAEGLKRFGEGYDALAVRIVNPDGSRFWDWATTGGTKGSVLLDYWDADPSAYITGGICVLKTEVLDRVQWDDSRGFYESEDVDFSTRLKAAGFTIRYNVFAAVLHDDDRYSRVERRIYQFDHLREAISQAHQAGELDEVRRLFPHAVRIAGNYVDRRKALQALVQRMNLPELLAEPTASKPVVPPATGPISATSGNNGKLEINWQGSFLDYGSLSNINRILTDTLVIQNGASIRRLQTAAVNGKLAKPLQSYRGKLAASANPNAALTVRHAWPPDWSRPASGKLAVMQPWEFGSLPKSWVEAARKVDAFWVPSNYVRQVYLDSGVPAEKVHVLPNGIDPKVFSPDAKPLKLATKKSFKFLFVGGTIYRKGPDVLLKAYVESFTAKDDVCLVIKDFGGGSVYAGQTLEQQIREIQRHANAPEILYLNQDLPPHELPGLYTACDCLAHPYRGEGFGLPVLEAMACGLPVIVSAGGATDDFVPDEAGYKIPAKRQVFGREISGMPLVGDGWLLEPDANAVKCLLRRAFANRDEARAKGRFASEHACKNWTWKHTAHRLAELARECVAVQRAAGSLPAASVTTAKRKPAQPLKITLPAVAKLGHLGAARELLQQGRFVPAWNAVVAALAIRPFHPEAYLLLAEIAGQTGDTKRMKECVDRARTLAPNWKTLKQFSKHHPARKSPGKVELPPLPANVEPRLSVCLIAKNEEKFLGQCLRSIKGIASQIIVVDTGSTDRTVAIAEEHGAEVHHFTWCDDFSAARNAALEHATGDWVLVLDADEELSPEGIAELKQAMNAANTISWRLPIVDAGKEAEGFTYVPRLFRNAPGLFYVSRVHEQVFSSVEVRREEWGMQTGVGTAKLIHHGYTAEVIKDRNKIARNLRLLELAIEEIPGDPNLLMNYGLELIRSERPVEGLSRYVEAFAALATKPANEVTPELRETLLTQYSSQLMKLGRWSEILTVLTSPVAQRGGLTASLHFTLGLAHQELRQWTEAVTQFRECLRTREQHSFYLVNPIILGGAPRHCLALGLWKSGELDAAAQEFTVAVAEDPSLAPLRMDAARFQSEHGDAVEALKLLHGLVTENSAFLAAWVLGARVALSHPDFIEFARDWTTEAVKHHPGNPDLIAARGETLLLTQQFADALPWWQRLDEAPRSLSARVLCELMQGELSIDEPPANEAETSREFLNWYRRLIQFRAGAGVQAIGERLELLGIVLPSAGRTLRQILEQAAVEAA